jgi:[ribosomal protein S5]-alanine N-acetyltransferase
MGRVPRLRTTVPGGELVLRALRRRDAQAWREVRSRNAAWLGPWEATVPPDSDEPVPTFGQMLNRFRAETRADRMIPWAIVYNGSLVGQLTVAGITFGSLRAASMGYWIDRRVAGHGLTPMAVAMAMDYCFDVLHLHRIEVVIRPENLASLRVAQKLRLRHEGARPAFLHIDGEWRDHEVFAIHADEATDGIALRLTARTRDTSPSKSWQHGRSARNE